MDGEKLCEIRNFDDKEIENNKFGDSSEFWTPDRKNLVEDHAFDKTDGIFFIGADQFINYFEEASVSYMLFGWKVSFYEQQ